MGANMFGKWAKWTVVNSAALAVMYYGLVLGVEGAANLAQFYVWATFTLSLVLLSDDVVRDLQKSSGLPVVMAWLGLSVDFLIVAVLVWYGWMWSAAAFLVHMVLMNRLRKPMPPKEDAAVTD